MVHSGQDPMVPWTQDKGPTFGAPLRAQGWRRHLGAGRQNDAVPGKISQAFYKLVEIVRSLIWYKTYKNGLLQQFSLSIQNLELQQF